MLRSAALEAYILEQLDKLKNRADNTAATQRASLNAKLLGLEVCVRVWCFVVCVMSVCVSDCVYCLASLQEQLAASPAPALVSGRVWESLGVVWANSGNFIRAIGAYRCTRSIGCHLLFVWWTHFLRLQASLEVQECNRLIGRTGAVGQPYRTLRAEGVAKRQIRRGGAFV